MAAASPSVSYDHVIDTETTGLNPAVDRIVEIAAVRLLDGKPTRRVYQAYANPGKRAVTTGAVAVNHLTDEFLATQQTFKEISAGFLSFIGGTGKLIVHNAAFDIAFLNAELKRCDLEPLHVSRFVCTLRIARSIHKDVPNDLDSLITRYKLEIGTRVVHGALTDAKILAMLYPLLSRR